MKMNISGGLLVAALAIASVAQAQTRTPVIGHKQQMQERRINQGVRSGELTRAQGRKLRTRERKLSNDKRMAKADGVVTHAERRHLRREEMRISRAIYREKHNGRLRG